MNRTHPGGRFAMIGLMTVLLVLTMCAIGATVIIWHATALASEAVHMNDLYQQAHYLVRSEASSLHEYVLDPDSQGRVEFRATQEQLTATLQTVARDGDTGDRAFVQLVLAEQSRYPLLAAQFFALIDAHQEGRASDFNNAMIEPLLARIDEQTATAADEDNEIATQSLKSLDITQQIVIASTVLIFATGLFLLALFWKVMRGYQRQLDEVRQAELVHMEQRALTDALTGLPNHRTMMDRVEVELLRCRENQQACAVVFVDLDHFKHINDTWGHRAGDAVLCEVGRRLKENLRQDDAVGRYGGEEFVLLLPNTNLREARHTVERLRVLLAEEPCALTDGEHASVETAIPVTASIGVAVYPEHGTSRAALIEAADRAMYYAKQTGRDRVCLAGEETELLPGVLATLPRELLTEKVTVQTLTAVASVHDGKSYPHGLAQSAIPLGARILSVVDSYDAMTSERSYRPALSDEAARAELQDCAGSQFDPQVVEAFLYVLDTIEQQAAPALPQEVPLDALPSSAGELPYPEEVRI